MPGFLTPEQQALIDVANAMKTQPFEQAVKALIAEGVLKSGYANWTYSAFQSAAQNLLQNPATQRAIGAASRRALTAAAGSGGRMIAPMLLGTGATVAFAIVTLLSAGALALAGYEGYRYYQSRQELERAERRAAEQEERVEAHRRTSQTASPRATETPKKSCPPNTPHKTMCPWAGAGYVGECGPGFCWDGGPHGTGACKLVKQPPNSRRTYTRDLICDPGFKAVGDECTHVLTACVAEDNLAP